MGPERTFEIENENKKMSASPSGDNVAKSLRPVVMVVVAAKVTIMAFLFANVAGVVSAPATADETTGVYFADSQR